MSTDPTEARGGQPSEEELRAAYEAEIKKLRVEQVVFENIVSLVNLGMRRTGLSPGTEDERDPGQVRLAIEAVRALTPLLDEIAPAQAKPIKDALSQLQLAFVRIGGQVPGADQEPGAPGPSQEPGAPGTGQEAGAPGAGQAAGAPGAASRAGSRPAGGGGPAPGSEPPPGGGRGPAPGTGQPEPESTKPGEPGPAQRSGRLWVPGQ
jgi:hypothetical protein